MQSTQPIVQPQTYTPATYQTDSVQAAVLTAPPSTPAPVPLPTSQNYVRPATTTKKSGGFMASIKGTFNKLTDKAQRTWNESTDERFRRYFGYPFTELLYGEFWGELWNGGRLVPCSVYLSTNYLCILAKVKDPISHVKSELKAQIALRDIIRIQRAIVLPSLTTGTAPIIQSVSDPSVRADSLQIFTRDGMMHQCSRFYNYEKFVATLEHLWHGATASVQPLNQPSISTAIPNTTPLAYPAPAPVLQKQAYIPTQPSEVHTATVTQAGGSSSVPYVQQTTTTTQYHHLP